MPGVGVELPGTLSLRKLLIPQNAKSEKNRKRAEARYTRGTRGEAQGSVDCSSSQPPVAAILMPKNDPRAPASRRFKKVRPRASASKAAVRRAVRASVLLRSSNSREGFGSYKMARIASDASDFE